MLDYDLSEKLLNFSASRRWIYSMLWWQGCGLGLRAHQMIEFAGLAL